MSFKIKKFIALIVFFIIMIVGGSLLLFYHYMITPNVSSKEDKIFVVDRNASFKIIINDLQEAKLISYKNVFYFYSRIKGYDKRIKAGEYNLNGKNPIQILDILLKGIIIAHSVTIPEGYTIIQIAELLEKKGIVTGDEFLAIAKSNHHALSFGFLAPTLEGFLYPDTYLFSRRLPPKKIIECMVNRFREVIATLNINYKQIGMGLEEIITLASIVEKETGQAGERSLIASVFLNRLKKKMRLESDPTVIYGIKNFNGNLTKKDLKKKTPYNTYSHRGLTPGAISNPGRAAIEAVLFPEKTDYLYFVSKNDGHHSFSRTLAEHNRAVRIFQKSRRHRKAR